MSNERFLTRYWFKTGEVTGFGVTGFSLEDARQLLAEIKLPAHRLAEIKEIIENIDVSTLEANHIRNHMGPPNFRGVWYPCMNLTCPP